MANNSSKRMSTDVDSQIKEIEKVLAHDTTLSMRQKELIAAHEHQLKNKLLDEEYKTKLKYIEEGHKAELQKLIDDQAKLGTVVKSTFKNAVEEAFSVDNITKGLNSITSNLESRMNNYLQKQQSIIAHLTGSNDSLDNVTKKMSTLSATGLVEQKAVYNNLHKLISSGIVANTEQRAFLQTLADDIDLTFNATDGSLVRLINLQRTDLTSSRMAIQYSLQTFLNQNYETSTYIKDSFTSVSDSLVEMQSLLSSSDAMSTEATIQKWLGSFSSAGGDSSTVTSLASALNAFGSGDISGLGKGVSNLLLMGATRTGQDISDILNNGLNANNVNTLMSGVTSYLQEMGGYESNVVKSQLASLFGVKISDLVAAQNMRGVGSEGSVTTDINSALLDEFGELVPASVRLSRYLENFMETWAMNTANDSTMYTAFKIGNMIGPVIGDVLGGVTKKIGSFSLDLGKIAQTGIQFLPTVWPFIKSVGSLIGNFSNGFDASSLYDLLENSNSTLNSAGSGFTTTGTTVSQSYSFSNGDNSSEGILDSIKNSTSGLGVDSLFNDEGEHSIEDVYNILDSGRVSVLGNSFDTAIGHAESIANVSQLTDENVSLIASISSDIYDLLNDHLASIDDNISLLANSSINTFDSNNKWTTTTI